MDRPFKMLLTLLVLLSGLAVAPAQARQCLGHKATVEQVDGSDAIAPIASSILSRDPGEALQRKLDRRGSRPVWVDDDPVVTPTIRIGDQARQ